jgi:hypothetical protein
MEALRSYTINAAFAGFEDTIKGSLKAGKLADVTVLSKDVVTIPEDQIPSTEVLYTIVGGKVEFSRRLEGHELMLEVVSASVGADPCVGPGADARVRPYKRL